jgi:hypothetical protein
MTDVIFLMIAIVFVLVAFATAFATMGASTTVRRITNRVTYGSCIAALASVVLAVCGRPCRAAGATRSIVY